MHYKAFYVKREKFLSATMVGMLLKNVFTSCFSMDQGVYNGFYDNIFILKSQLNNNEIQADVRQSFNTFMTELEKFGNDTR